MKYDTHVHTTFSPDAVSTFEDYSRKIDEGKVCSIGFTEHVDFLPECGAYGFFDYNAFMEKIGEYRRKGYDFHAGAEIDYVRSVEEDIKVHLQLHSYEYTICSVHMINGVSISNGKKREELSSDAAMLDMLEKYYSEVYSGVKSNMFDIIAHIGIYRRSLKEEYINEKIGLIIKEYDNELAKTCAKSDIILEVNSSGLYSPISSTFPDMDFLKLYYKYGGRRISMGSDAHNAENIAMGFDMVEDILREIGFTHICIPWERDRIIKI